MAQTLVIGDVQGCYEPLCRLLEKVQFADGDRLVFVGDLINRGPDSVSVLQFVSSQVGVHTVLGNHDLHFLAVAAGVRGIGKGDTLDDLLAHPSCMQWCEYLRQAPLMLRLHASSGDFVVAHAGVWPLWTFEEASRYAAEVEVQLRGADWREFLAGVFGNFTGTWSDELSAMKRAPFIVNTFTRMRYLCQVGGEWALDFHHKQHPKTAHEGLVPWYKYQVFSSSFGVEKQEARSEETLGKIDLSDERQATVLFGHWASLGLLFDGSDLNGGSNLNDGNNLIDGNDRRSNGTQRHAICLDTGCVWGGLLTALRLETGELIQVHHTDKRLFF